MRKLFLLSSILLSTVLSAQFTYFNQIAGGVSDTLADAYYNVELIDDTIYTYGVIIDLIDGFRYKLGKFDMEGNLILQKEYLITSPIFYAETTASFVKTDDETAFYMSVGFADSVQSGMIGKVNRNLDTLWTKRYDNFYPYTHMKRNMDVGDGVVIVGEIESDGTQRGTMLTKIDHDGEIIWDEVLRHANGHIYRNGSIVEHEGYYLVGGYRDLAGDSPRKGYLTKCSPIDGDREWEYIDSDAGFGMGIGYEVCTTTGGKLLAAGTVQYEDGPSSLDWYTKIRVLEVDIIEESIINETEYFADEEISNAWVVKIIGTSDGGALILGNETSEVISELSAYLLKLDSLGNEEWYQEYAYEFGDNHWTTPYDLEQTSDGGYIVAGEFSDFNSGSGQRGWLLKIDACGDLEWQGCELPDGLWDISTALDEPLHVHPNPARELIYVDAGTLIAGRVILIFDNLGRVVMQTTYQEGEAIDISTLDNGMYTLSMISSAYQITCSLAIQR